MRKVKYKGGLIMVSREDEPTYQCLNCYKPWWKDDLDFQPFLAYVECPSCGNRVRTITENSPLITK
ncbi:hypothetical protein ACED51_24155 [Photobacterium swingsii]|uniref:hypothetical protein n=1 Tax=Photobacterium swingsii TaxID=680026 RepID=UPI00352CA5CA